MGRISPERRDFLRLLRRQFDEACARLDPSTDRSDPVFREANELYRDWHRAMDRDAMALLDDLDAAEARRRGRTDAPRSGPVSSTPALSSADIERVFEAVASTMRLRDDIAPSDMESMFDDWATRG